MPEDRPNLLFVFADQMRGTAMGCAGNRQVRTPAMDRLAAEGMMFRRAYANFPVCTPSRGTILTGRYALGHGAVANDVPLGEDAVTFAHVLGAAGYRTGYIGKWHLDGVPRNRFTPPGPRRFGFEFWAAWNCSHRYLDARVYRDDPEPVHLAGYEPAAQTDLALEFLDSGEDRPFALALSWGPPHNPYDKVPERFKAMVEADGIGLRPNVPADSADRARRDLAGYYAHVMALDEQLGRLLDALEARGLAENTVVVFTSDHGDMLGSQGMQRKQQPWEESVGIPLVARWPGHVPAGARSETLVSTVDLAPTLLSLLGCEPPDGTDGADLSAAWLGGGGEGPDSVFLADLVSTDEGWMQGLAEWRGVRTARYTYARWFDGRPWILYDNESDPHQMENLAASPAHCDVRNRLDARVDAWLRQTGDPSVSWQEMLRQFGLVDAWNARERDMHAELPRLVRS